MNISNRLRVTNRVPHLEDDQNHNKEFLLGIFGLGKCQKLSEKDRGKIEEAFSLACEAHAKKIRKDRTPYMNHISDVLWAYIRITQQQYVLAEDLIVVILHDVLEDHPEFAPQIIQKFGWPVFQRVENVSKPSSQVIATSHNARIEAIFSGRWTPIIQANVIRFVRQLIIWEYLTPEYMRLIDYIRSLPVNDSKEIESVQFLMKIMFLSPSDFEIKVADRISNLTHLKAVNENYLVKNLFSTCGYFLKAKALGRHDLVRELRAGMIALACMLEKKVGTTGNEAFFQSSPAKAILHYGYPQ